MRTAVHVAAAGGGRAPGITGRERGVMEYKVVTNLKPVNGDKTWFRQWHLKFTTALGQAKYDYEWMVNKMTKEIDLGKDLGTILEDMSIDNLELFKSTSADIWRVLIDKTEAEAYEKIKSIPQGEGLKAYGVLYRWFTDVSGLGLAEQARRLMHPKAPKNQKTWRSTSTWDGQAEETRVTWRRVQIGSSIQDQRTEDDDSRKSQGILRPAVGGQTQTNPMRQSRTWS